MARTDVWTLEADDLLAAEWGLWPNRDIARWLGRSVKACEARAAVIGVRKRDNLQAVIDIGEARQRQAAYQQQPDGAA